MTTGVIDQLLVRVDADTRGVTSGMQRSSAATQQASQKMAASLKTADASVKQVDASVKRMDASLQRANRTVATGSRRLSAATSGHRRMQLAVQNSAFQVGDFAVQVASGTGAMRAFAQQAPQLLGGFGVIGAVAGAAIAVVSGLAVALTTSGDSAEDAAEEHEKLQQELQRVAKEAEETKKRIEELANAEEQLALKTARSTASIAARNELGLAQRLASAESDPIQAQRAYIDNQQKIFDGFINELGVLEQVAERDRDLEEQRSRHVRNYADSLREELRVRQLSEEAQEVEAALAEARNAAREEGRDLTEEEAAEVARLTSELSKLEREQKAATKAGAAAQRQSDKNTQALQRQAQSAAKLIRSIENENRVLAERVQFGDEAADALQREIRQREALGPLYDENADQIRELNAANDNLTEALERQQEQQKEAARAAREAAAEMERDIERATDTIADAFERMLFDGGNAFDVLKDIARQSFMDIARNAVIRPTVQAVFGGGVGASGGGFSVPGFGGGSIPVSGGGGGFSLGGLLSGGSSIFGGGSLTAPSAFASDFIFGRTGQALGFSSLGAGGMGPAAPTALGNAFGRLSSPAGSIGGFAGNFAGNALFGGDRGIGADIGGSLGAIAGSFIPIPGVGTFLGSLAGNWLGGLFGGEQSPPIGHTNLMASGGRLVVGGTGTDNGASGSVTQQMAAQAAQIVNQFADQFGLTVTASQMAGFGVHGNTGAITQGPNGAQYGPQSVEGFLNLFFQRASSNFSSDNAAVNRLLAAGGDMNSLSMSLTEVTSAEEAIARLAEALDGTTDPLDQIRKQFEDLRETAVRFGLDVATVDRAMQAELDRFTLGIEASVLQQVGGELSAIQSFQLNRSLSGSATPLDRVDAAQAAVQASLEAVRDGDTGAVGSLLNNAQTLLQVGAQAFGTATPEFAALERFTDRTVASVASQIGDPQAIQDRVTAAIEAQTSAQSQDSELLRQEVQGLRAEIRVLARSLSDSQAA